MSQSPSYFSISPKYLLGWKRNAELVRAGASWSGHERNCVFYNVGQQRFANVSAAVGLDQIEDSRATGLVDWDLDGDLDLWITNRNAPGIRYLRNDTPANDRFIAFRLVGKTCNRDAIGARLELFTAPDSPDEPLRRIKTLHAGDGFLTQSSRWVHFGLGDAGQIERLVVHWPGGQPQQFTGLEVGRRYELLEGSATATDVTPNGAAAAPLASSDQTDIPAALGASNTPMIWPLPLPALSCQDLDGNTVPWNEHPTGPTLMTLWASWCQPCLAELKELARRRDDLAAAGINVVTINIELAADDARVGPAEIRQILKRLEVPFSVRLADRSFMQQLQKLQDAALNRSPPISLPTSLLVDANNRLICICRGPVSVDRLLQDIQRLSAPEGEFVQAALPFTGRWRQLPPGPQED